MNVNGQKFQSLYALMCKSLAWRNHRTTLPQSRPLGVTAPSGREPGMGAYHLSDRPETVGLRAIFIAPTKTQKPFPFTIQRTTLPQLRIRSAAPSGREPGWGAYHLSDRPETGRLRAIFIAPTEAQKILHSTAHRGGGGGRGIEKAAISDIRLYPLGEMWYNGRENTEKSRRRMGLCSSRIRFMKP